MQRWLASAATLGCRCDAITTQKIRMPGEVQLFYHHKISANNRQSILRAVESAECTVEWIVEDFQDAESGAWAGAVAGCSRSRRWTMPRRRSSRWARKMMLEGDAVEFSADRTDCANKDLFVCYYLFTFWSFLKSALLQHTRCKCMRNVSLN